MLAGIVKKFHYLKYGIGVVLVFVGLKMTWLNEVFGGKFPIAWSLIIIISVVALSILISFIKKEKEENNELPSM
jgi:tellurite resistance protein TerC